MKAAPNYEGKFSVPVLWDKKTETIVNNESAEIMRMLYTEFDDFVEPKYKGLNFYSPENAKKIDELNDWILRDISSRVYKAGLATTQADYELHVTALFEGLDRLEALLSKGGPYLLGDTLTEADLRLYPSIVRFDPVYVQHFKCNLGMIRYDYPAIHKWLQRLYWDHPEFKSTTQFDHIKQFYTKSQVQINPTGITPLGPLPHMVPK